jgi:hypothetical protein
MQMVWQFLLLAVAAVQLVAAAQAVLTRARALTA